MTVAANAYAIQREYLTECGEMMVSSNVYASKLKRFVELHSRLPVFRGIYISDGDIGRDVLMLGKTDNENTKLSDDEIDEILELADFLEENNNFKNTINWETAYFLTDSNIENRLINEGGYPMTRAIQLDDTNTYFVYITGVTNKYPIDTELFVRDTAKYRGDL